MAHGHRVEGGHAVDVDQRRRAVVKVGDVGDAVGDGDAKGPFAHANGAQQPVAAVGVEHGDLVTAAVDDKELAAVLAERQAERFLAA